MQSTTQLKHETAGESFSGLAGAALHDRVIHWCLGRGALGSRCARLTAHSCQLHGHFGIPLALLPAHVRCTVHCGALCKILQMTGDH